MNVDLSTVGRNGFRSRRITVVGLERKRFLDMERPGVLKENLCGTVLDLAGLPARDPRDPNLTLGSACDPEHELYRDFWVDRPDLAALRKTVSTLRSLGALDPDGYRRTLFGDELKGNISQDKCQDPRWACLARCCP